ncbi:hypothetical protein [Geothermobacter hydrogeniphilus]|uniref:hypothetical protein n=1 Tax=Geothermobacter hydrogeniphilus TaxID=1969733 RepID=UPI00111C7FCA|nr:hypothetical protein [Geothermobacter hydrogeniphilus]
MRDFHLRFFIDRRWPDGIEELIEDGETMDSIPKVSGAYILGTSDGSMLTYPWGSSPVFYIGQSSNLFKRIKDHKKYIIQAIDDHEEKYWWPRYQFGASFGTTVAWYSTRGTQNPNTLESDLITKFYEMYGSIPLANGTWPSGLRPKHGSRDDQ